LAVKPENNYRFKKRANKFKTTVSKMDSTMDAPKANTQDKFPRWILIFPGKFPKGIPARTNK